MRTCIIFAKILTLGLCIPSVLSCSSGDETPPYNPAGSKPTTNPASDAGIRNDGGPSTVMDCSVNGTAGCPCTEAGATADCGRIDYISGDYVTCVIGTAKCDGTQWGVCEGNRIVAQNHRNHSLTASGIQLLSLGTGCNIPCDPACTKVVGQQSDVDAGTLTINDAGITITPTTGTGPGSGPCKGLWCQVQSCQGLPKTSLSGKVYDPAGKNPLYNAYVYVPVDPSVPLPAFADGASCDTCSGAGAVSAISVAQTGADGKFTLTNVPAGDGVALVVQMGKWRRMVTLPTVTACTNNVVTPSYSHLPRNRFDGDKNTADIPRMAIATGKSDPFECLLLKAGIDSSEIMAPGNNTRIDYYVYNGGRNRSPGGAPSGTTLTNSLTTLKKYDVVLLPCEGSEYDHVAHAPNVASFADLGGRVFATHYGYSWLATSSNGVAQNKTEFYGTADWSKLDQSYSATYVNDPMSAVIDQSFPKGAAFAQWLQNLGATTTLGKTSINEPRRDARSAISPSQRWIYGSSRVATSGTSDMLLSMTFNTPVGVAQDKQCGRVVFSDFHVSADALASTSVTNCSSDNDCGVTSVCNPPVTGLCSDVSCKTNAECTTGFSCMGSAQGSCSTQSCHAASECGTGRTCPGGAAGNCSLPCFYNSTCTTLVSSTSVCNGETIGACSALSCKADADCGGATATCSGESIGNCQPTAKSCYKTSDCTSLNASATCSGGATGTCSTTCKANSDCGTQTCSGFKVGACVPPTTTCYSNSDCTSLNASSTCSGGALGSCAAGTCKVSSDCGSGTCTGAVVGICKKTNGTLVGPCYTTADCTGTQTCVANPTSAPKLGACSLNTCKTNTDCGGRSCNGEAAGSCVGPTASCWANSDCAGLGSSYTCSGATIGACPAKTGCTANTDCGGTRTCSGQALGACTGPSKTCWATSDCSSLGSAYSCINPVLGSCTSKTCTVNSDCGTIRTCQNAVVGACSGITRACTADSTCTSKYGSTSSCNGDSVGACSAGTCYTSADCGTSGTCTNGQLGDCSKACTTDAQCGTLTCVSGECQGCLSDATCQSNSCVGEVASKCSAASSMFPLTCKNGDLSAQEKALEFMLFDLSACVSPDSWTPPTPGISFGPVTFNLDFMATCPSDKRPIWREFDWQSQVPSTANIAFNVQTADTSSGLTTAQSVALATATTSTTLPGWDVAIIDTTTAGAFQKVDPPIMSKSYLRVATTLNPTSDNKASPTLINWEVHYDCVFSQ